MGHRRSNNRLRPHILFGTAAEYGMSLFSTNRAEVGEDTFDDFGTERKLDIRDLKDRTKSFSNIADRILELEKHLTAVKIDIKT